MRFEGNFYIRRKFLRTDGFKVNGVLGVCPYKFLYVWLDLKLDGREPSKYLGWLYWLPNPLLPFIWWRVALPGIITPRCWWRYWGTEGWASSIPLESAWTNGRTPSIMVTEITLHADTITMGWVLEPTE